MGKRYLLDTNIAIFYIDNKLPDTVAEFIDGILKVECNISVISKMELLGWQAPSQEDIKTVENFVNDCTVFLLSDAVVEKVIEIRRVRKIKLPDAIIAATALVNNFILISHNDQDFKSIKSLKYLNPFKDAVV